MARGYRAILELPEKEDALEVSYQLFHKWLNDKYLPPERERSIEFDDDGIYRFGELTRRSKGQIEEVTVTRLRESSKDRHYHRQLLEVVDTSNRNGRWTTRMYSMTATKESRYHQVIWVEVIPPASSEEPAQRPNLVVDLVKSYDVHESGVSISDRVQNIVDEGQVDQLTDSIFNQQRRVAIVVAAPISDENDCEAHDQWREVLNTLTDDSFGCASYFLLKPDVYDYFCQQVGDLKLEQGCLRTYLPKVNLEDETDPKRHRILTSSTLYHGLDGKTKKFRRELSQIIARTPCSYIWEKGLDGELKSAQDVLNKQRMKVPTFRLPLSSEVRTEGTEEAEVSAAKVVEDTVQAVLARKKTKGTALRPREQAATLQTQQVASDIQRTDRSGRPQWAAPLIELIRRFAPMFDPRTHDDMSDGVEALSAGLSVIDERYNDLAQKVHKLTRDFQGEKNRLQKEIDDYEALFDQAEENSKAVERVAELEERIEEQEEDRKEERAKYRELENKVRRLEHQLRNPQTGLQGYDYVEEQLDMAPDDMATLFDWMTKDGMYPQVREYVVFCDPNRMSDAILTLDDMSGNSRYAADFWKFILVLRDYMRALEAGDFSGGLHDYLDKSIGVYRTCSQKRHSPTESETVQNNGNMRKKKDLPCPYCG